MLPSRWLFAVLGICHLAGDAGNPSKQETVVFSRAIQRANDSSGAEQNGSDEYTKP
jgi:hypothetical protein